MNWDLWTVSHPLLVDIELSKTKTEIRCQNKFKFLFLGTI